MHSLIHHGIQQQQCLVSLAGGPQYATWYNGSAIVIAASNGVQKTSGGSGWNATAETQETTSQTVVGIEQTASGAAGSYATLALVDAAVANPVGNVHPTPPAYSAYRLGSNFYRIINGSSVLISANQIQLGDVWGIRRVANGDLEWYVDDTVFYTLPAASHALPAEIRGRAALYHVQVLDNIRLLGSGWAIS